MFLLQTISCLILGVKTRSIFQRFHTGIFIRGAGLLPDHSSHPFNTIDSHFAQIHNGVVEVVEHTKTNSDRFVTQVPQAIHLIQSIPHGGDFIFMRDGKRITARQAEYVLDKYAERQGLKIKSSHKIRKTYASMLNAAGVPLDEIREQLGHTNLNTTLGYIKNHLRRRKPTS